MTALTGITHDDIRIKLNPTNEPDGFLGSASAVTHADVDNTILEWEDTIFSRLPARYKRLLTRVDGEVLTKYATGSETTFTLSLLTASNLKLYVNLACPWDGRCYADEWPTTNYSYVGATGVITPTGTLAQGSTLIAEYDHTGLGGSKLLRRLVQDLVAVEWARRLYSDEGIWERIQGWESQAYTDIGRMFRNDEGRLGIRLFDNIELINPTTMNRQVAEPADFNGGMM